jgi:hypothetical protein
MFAILFEGHRMTAAQIEAARRAEEKREGVITIADVYVYTVTTCMSCRICRPSVLIYTSVCTHIKCVHKRLAPCASIKE